MLKKPGLLLGVMGLLLAQGLSARVYYVNQGVRYHVGDDRANRSVDSTFIDTYPVVGEQWIQAFRVSSADDVKVHIDHLWGVDDCPYCKDMVSIDSHDMGRLSNANNHESFDTLTPLAFHAEPGRTYYLKIQSYSLGGQNDDFVFEGVRVETERAEVTFLKPGPVIKMPEQPMPQEAAPRPLMGPCEASQQVTGWLPGSARSRGMLDLQEQADLSLPLSLDSGQFVQLFAKADESANGDRVSQALEILLGGAPGGAPSGWAFSFAPGSSQASHGNLKLKGRYMSQSFPVSAWKAGQWNELRLARCPDGSCRLWLNGSQVGPPLSQLDPGPQVLKLKILGLHAQFSDKPF